MMSLELEHTASSNTSPSDGTPRPCSMGQQTPGILTPVQQQSGYKFWNQVMSDDPETEQEVVTCVVCLKETPTVELDAHLCTDHLDYYPFSCGHCSSFMPSEELAYFHAQRKNHLPLKIRETAVLAKEKELRKLMQQCMAGGTRSAEVVALVTGHVSPNKNTFHDQAQRNMFVPSAPPPLVQARFPPLVLAQPQSLSYQSHSRPARAIEAIAASLSDNNADHSDGDTTETYGNGTGAAAIETDEQGSSGIGKIRLAPPRFLRKKNSPWFGSRRRKRPNPRRASLEDGEMGLGAASPPKKIAGRSTVKEEEGEKKNSTGAMTNEEIRETLKNGQTCRECKAVVGRDRMSTHVKGHMNKSRPTKACKYCNYKGHSTPGIKIHIIRTHGKDLGNSDGVVDLNETASTFPEMSLLCFGVDIQDDSSTRHTPVKEETLKEEQEYKPTQASFEDEGVLKCGVCRQMVGRKGVKGHVNKHLATRPLFACSYCNFKGRSAMAVRVHISWRHVGKSAKHGVKSVGSLGGTFDQMLQTCFGQDTAAQDPSLVSKSTSVLRPFGRRATKSIGSSGGGTLGSPGRQAAGSGATSNAATSRPATRGSSGGVGSSPANQEGSSGVAGCPGVTRIGTMPSGRKCRYMRCEVCGAEIVDALVSAHVYQSHLRAEGAVQCPYCHFSHYYAIAEVKKHIGKKHPGSKVEVEDNRASLQDKYLQWRTKCFPNVGIDWRSTRKAAAAADRSDGVSMVKGNSGITPTKMSRSQGGVEGEDGKRESGDEDGEDSVMNNLLSLLREGEREEEEGRITNTSHNGIMEGSPNTRGSGAGAGSQPVKRYTAAHYKNSLKNECGVCGVEVTNLWRNRHIWKHLDMIGKPRYKCQATGCVFETYLLRTLDTHVNHVHETGKTAADVGYADRGSELQGDWKNLWVQCFNEEVPPNESLSSATGGSLSSTNPLEEDHGQTTGTPESPFQGGTSFTPQPSTRQGSPPKNILVSLGLGALGENTEGSLDPYLEDLAGNSPEILEGLSSLVTGGATGGMPLEAWCQECNCSVPTPEIEEHVWYAHLGGVFPFRCQLCQSSFMTVSMMEEHWTLTHSDRPLDTMQLVEVPEARENYETKLVECFPEIAGDMVESGFRDGANRDHS